MTLTIVLLLQPKLKKKQEKWKLEAQEDTMEHGLYLKMLAPNILEKLEMGIPAE